MENNSRSERRFRFYHYYFYVGGVPLFDFSVSYFYQAYSFLCHGCAYTTLIAMFMDIYHHSEDWDHIMDMSMLFTLFVCESYTLVYFR